MKTKARRTFRIVLPLALLSVAFLLGCQEQGSEIMGPQLKKGGGGGGGKKTETIATVTLTSGFIGGPQPGRGLGTKDNGMFGFMLTTTVQTNFANSFDNWQADCAVDPPGADANALAQALVGEHSVTTTARVDTTNLGEPSENNRIGVFEIETEGVRYVRLGTSSLFPELSPSVTNYTDIEGTIEFMMTGGVVVVRSDGPPSRAVKLHCPNRDVVTVTVVRESN